MTYNCPSCGYDQPEIGFIPIESYLRDGLKNFSFTVLFCPHCGKLGLYFVDSDLKLKEVFEFKMCGCCDSEVPLIMGTDEDTEQECKICAYCKSPLGN